MIKRIGFITLVLAIALSSCDKEQDLAPAEEAEFVAEDLSSVQYLLDDLELTVDEAVETRDPQGACVDISFKNPRGTFPNTVTFDFGDGCEGPRGHVRTGMIIVEQSAPMHEEGAVRVTTFEDFTIDDILIEGQKVLSNTGPDTDGYPTFTRNVEITLTFPNGMTAMRTSSHVRTQILGSETPEFADDVFEITGSGEGVNRLGHAFTTVITEPLLKRRTCRWIESGIIRVTVTTDADELLRVLDFGYPDGACDPFMEVTLADGTTRVVHIHKRWW